MRFTAILALFIAMLTPAAAQTSDQQLIMNVSADRLTKIVEDLGHTHLQASEDDSIWVYAESSSGKYTLLGTACSDGSCFGIQMFTSTAGGVTLSTDELVSVNDRYAAAKASILNGQIMISRYIVLDGGVSSRNIEKNIEVLQSITPLMLKELGVETSDAPNEQASSASSIDFGTDDGRYANDQSCDDARFKPDGDDWDFMREHVLNDATDCKAAYESGDVQLLIDFGDDSGGYAFDGACDDRRFDGEGRSILKNDSHVRKDASDCVFAYREGKIHQLK